jgi:fructoselysine-6-P-deglycase FrlB-like protein
MTVLPGIEKAKASEFFTSPVLARDLGHLLGTDGEHVRELARRAWHDQTRQVLFVGSGGSWANMYSGQYLTQRFTSIPARAVTGYDLVFQDSPSVDDHALVFLTSYSGETEDILAALEFVQARGARTIAITRSGENTLAQAADDAITYNSIALYACPLAVIYLFATELGRLAGHRAAGDLQARLFELPPRLDEVYHQTEGRARDLAQTYKDETLFYVLGAGPLYGLAYKFALTVFMENLQVHGSIIDSSEFRHGPCEMLARQHPAMVFLVGTDETHDMTLRVLQFVAAQGARPIVYDMADYPDIHPLLSPFVFLVPLEWFTVYSAVQRGIFDLDSRVYMGKGILAQGRGKWP